jgi:hypothetical protein
MLKGGTEVIVGAITDGSASASWWPSASAACWSKC